MGAAHSLQHCHRPLQHLLAALVLENVLAHQVTQMGLAAVHEEGELLCGQVQHLLAAVHHVPGIGITFVEDEGRSELINQ